MTKEALKLALKVYEMHTVARERLCNGAVDGYFDANPAHDNDVGRKLFEQGFARGFDSAAELASSGAYDVFRCFPVYRDPPQRKPLTEQEIWDAVQHGVVGSIGFVSKAVAVARAIEAAHGIKE